jgi:hypothetical protein
LIFWHSFIVMLTELYGWNIKYINQAWKFDFTLLWCEDSELEMFSGINKERLEKRKMKRTLKKLEFSINTLKRHTNVKRNNWTTSTIPSLTVCMQLKCHANWQHSWNLTWHHIFCIISHDGTAKAVHFSYADKFS